MLIRICDYAHLDEKLLDRALELTGIREKSALIRAGLEALEGEMLLSGLRSRVATRLPLSTPVNLGGAVAGVALVLVTAAVTAYVLPCLRGLVARCQ